MLMESKPPNSSTHYSVAEGETRVGLLFGSVETRQPPKTGGAGGKQQPVRGRAVKSLASEVN